MPDSTHTALLQCVIFGAPAMLRGRMHSLHSMPPSSSLLDRTLSAIARRYRLPEFQIDSSQIQELSPETALALIIEQARIEKTRDSTAVAALQQRFIDSLARLIASAMHPRTGDAVFQATLLRYREPTVSEYASLSSQAERDRRSIHAAVNSMAHPERHQRMPPGEQREWLGRLYEAAAASSWAQAEDIARRLLDLADADIETSVKRRTQQLLDSGALARLQRLQALEDDELVRRYRSLWDRHGPRSGSAAAAAQGVASKHRGAEVEALATRALEAFAERLGKEEAHTSYRVVTSMRVPASIPSSHEHAKTEWDVVLLRHAGTSGDTATWDIRLLVEAKASVDAASTDLPRLLRGLRLLAHADANANYAFETQQGAVHVRGASLTALPTEGDRLANTVLYCCDAPADSSPRLLNAASRMQLLSAPESVAYASMLTDNPHADACTLEPVWHALLESPRWRVILDQYAILRQARDLMVHTDDLLAAMRS
ncbi:hypothetical protein AWB72_01257 [Caballeronia concitans]|uniref:3-deoxy-D-arabino-heptulosonate 7-phosphate synthase n=2 Tax=Caballeronia concitans TaxID=1777133 RepID=A0A658QTG6_9BURK|nr:hypothetical protein AWB72_01257 [Caballeronia concitans]